MVVECSTCKRNSLTRAGASQGRGYSDATHERATEIRAEHGSFAAVVGARGMSPTMTGEHGPQSGGSAWILARAASLSKGARALLAGARDVWTILKG